MRRQALGLMALVLAAWSLPVFAVGSVAAPSSSLWDGLGRLHPALVHFPVALLVTALGAELMCILRRDARFADAARFMVSVAGWTGVAAALAGFARADTVVIPTELEGTFAIHRVAGIVTPVLAVLAAGLAAGVRRSGQIWELFLYRIVLILATIAAVVAGFCGGEIVHGAGFFPRW